MNAIRMFRIPIKIYSQNIGIIIYMFFFAWESIPYTEASCTIQR